MIIKIKGGTRSQQKYVRRLTKYCVNKMMPRMHSLEFNIHLHSFNGDKDTYGYCVPDQSANRDRPREFNIELNKGIKLRRLLETLAHELVHAKQFARGELYQSTITAKSRWHGKWIARDPNYWDCPWEIEAHGREAGLFIQWCEKERIGHLLWTQQGA